MLTMMSYDIIFEKKLERIRDWVSPEYYEIEIDGKIIGFDFFEYMGEIDKTDPRILHMKHHILDVDSFPDAAKINPQNLLIGEFREFYVECEEDNFPVSITNLEFKFEENTETIATPELEKTATEALAKYIA